MTMVLNVQTIHPLTEHHITEDLWLQQKNLENLKSWISLLNSCGYVSTHVFTVNVTLSANPFEYPYISLNLRPSTPLRTLTETQTWNNLINNS
jgi:hypothetical protein